MESGDIPSVHLKDFEPVSADVLTIFPEGLVRKSLIVPLAKRDGRVVAAVPKTSGLVKPAGLKLLAGCPVDLVLAPTDEIIAFIKAHYAEEVVPDETPAPEPVPEPVINIAPVPIPEPAPVPPPAPVLALPPVPVPAPAPAPVLPPSIYSKPNPELFNRMVNEIVQNHASEGLFDLKGENVRVRHRIRGIIAKPPSGVAWTKGDVLATAALVRERGENHSAEGVKWTELQVSVNVTGDDYDCLFNLSETATLTLLSVKVTQYRERLFDLLGWGLDAVQARTLEGLLAREQGVILFCGAEQDGATATLNSCVRKLAVPSKHVICVESYIDQWIQDADQFNAKGDGALFSKYLETALSHSPDILKVRPLDSREAWEMCLRESMRGPLILAGSFARDSAEAISGILRMGVDPSYVSSGLLAVVAQRRLRLNCQYCQEKETVQRERLREIGIPVELQPSAFYYGKGCEHCHKTGFGNETYIFEILAMNDDLKNVLHRDASTEKIRMAAKTSGTLTLRQVAIHKAIAGQTSLAEVIRVSPK